MPKVRTVWRHYSQVFASFALYQVDCLAADKRAASVGFRGVFTLVLAHVSKRERNCAQPFLHTAKSVSQRRVRSMRGHGTAGRVRNQDGHAAPCPLGAALFVLAQSQQGKRPRPRRNMQVRASHRPALQPSDMCQPPERTSGMTYRISRGGLRLSARRQTFELEGGALNRNSERRQEWREFDSAYAGKV